MMLIYTVSMDPKIYSNLILGFTKPCTIHKCKIVDGDWKLRIIENNLFSLEKVLGVT